MKDRTQLLNPITNKWVKIDIKIGALQKYKEVGQTWRGKVSDLESKCCGVKIYYDFKKLNKFIPQPHIGLRHVPHCNKCHKPCEVKRKSRQVK